MSLRSAAVLGTGMAVVVGMAAAPPSTAAVPLLLSVPAGTTAEVVTPRR